MAWTKTKKVEYVARQLDLNTRTVWEKLSKAELDLEQFEFPKSPPEDLEKPTEKAEAPATIASSPDIVFQLMKDQLRDRDQLLMEMGELKERVKWLSSENTYLKQEVKLLKAPPEPVAEPPKIVAMVSPPPEPSFSQRVAEAWRVFRGLKPSATTTANS